MVITRQSIADTIGWAREQLHELGVRDKMRALSRREYVDALEALEDEPAEPAVVGGSDVEDYVNGWLAEAQRMRSHAEAKAGLWREHVRQRWLARADELVDRVQRLRGQP